MPIYLYQCSCGLRIERLVKRDADTPVCPECGITTLKIPAASSLGRRAGANPAKDRIPPAWRGVYEGGPERVRREVAFRQRLEAKAGDPTTGSGGASSGPGPGSGSEPSAPPSPPAAG